MVERPFNLDRTADDGFRLAHHAAERHRLRGVKTRRADEYARHRLRHGAGAVGATLAVMLAAGVDLAQKPLAREHDAVRDDLALRDGGAEPPGCADKHPAGGRLAQTAAGGARVDQRLDE